MIFQLLFLPEHHLSIVESAVLSYLEDITKKVQRVLGVQEEVVMRFCREVEVVPKLTYFPVN